MIYQRSNQFHTLTHWQSGVGKMKAPWYQPIAGQLVKGHLYTVPLKFHEPEFILDSSGYYTIAYNEYSGDLIQGVDSLALDDNENTLGHVYRGLWKIASGLTVEPVAPTNSRAKYNDEYTAQYWYDYSMEVADIRSTGITNQAWTRITDYGTKEAVSVQRNGGLMIPIYDLYRVAYGFDVDGSHVPTDWSNFYAGDMPVNYNGKLPTSLYEANLFTYMDSPFELFKDYLQKDIKLRKGRIYTSMYYRGTGIKDWRYSTIYKGNLYSAGLDATDETLGDTTIGYGRWPNLGNGYGCQPSILSIGQIFAGGMPGYGYNQNDTKWIIHSDNEETKATYYYGIAFAKVITGFRYLDNQERWVNA